MESLMSKTQTKFELRKGDKWIVWDFGEGKEVVNTSEIEQLSDGSFRAHLYRSASSYMAGNPTHVVEYFR